MARPCRRGAQAPRSCLPGWTLLLLLATVLTLAWVQPVAAGASRAAALGRNLLQDEEPAEGVVATGDADATGDGDAAGDGADKKEQNVEALAEEVVGNLAADEGGDATEAAAKDGQSEDAGEAGEGAADQAVDQAAADIAEGTAALGGEKGGQAGKEGADEQEGTADPGSKEGGEPNTGDTTGQLELADADGKTASLAESEAKWEDDADKLELADADGKTVSDAESEAESEDDAGKGEASEYDGEAKSGEDEAGKKEASLSASFAGDGELEPNDLDGKAESGDSEAGEAADNDDPAATSEGATASFDESTPASGADADALELGDAGGEEGAAGEEEGADGELEAGGADAEADSTPANTFAGEADTFADDKRFDLAPVKPAPAGDELDAALDPDRDDADADADGEYEGAGKAVGGAGGMATADPEPLSGESLEAAVKEAALAQQEGDVVEVVAQEVQQAPPAKLANGDGDVATDGACWDVFEKSCPEVRPGDGRLAACVMALLESSPQAVSKECMREVDSFKVARARNINSNVPLARACKKDVKQLCKDTDDGRQPGSVLACLRAHKDELSEKCGEQVFRAQLEAARDFRTDTALYDKCHGDAERVCRDLEPHNGEVQACLRAYTLQLSWDCQEELFRVEVENAGDMRLAVRLFRACLEDKRAFCADVAPGNSRALDCLEEHREDPAFTATCKAEIDNMIERRVTDLRLDPIMAQHCVDDAERMCGYKGYKAGEVLPTASISAQQPDPKSAVLLSLPDRDSYQVVKCLQDFSEDISDDACKARVRKVKALAAQDIRFDMSLAEACYDDRQRLCGSVPPGSARVIRCLRKKLAQLSNACSSRLFDQEVSMAENIDYQAPLKAACDPEILQYCAGVPHGNGRVIRCLQDHADAADVSSGCREELRAYEKRAASDYRLNPRLNAACSATIDAMCGGLCGALGAGVPCGGAVLRCLAEKYEEIADATCQSEVFYFMKLEVKDFRNDVLLAENCRADISVYCKDVEPGEGRVILCLQKHREQLTPGCRAEAVQLELMAASNIDLRPNLAASCASERRAHCADVRAGRSRVLNCLLHKSELVDFSMSCMVQLRDTVSRRMRDWRTDVQLRMGCMRDVTQVCAGETKSSESGSGAVFGCLLRSASAGRLSQRCTQEVQRAARTALDLYTEGLPGVGTCDADVRSYCQVTASSGSALRVGTVRDCLMRVYPLNASTAAFDMPAQQAAAMEADEAAVSTGSVMEAPTAGGAAVNGSAKAAQTFSTFGSLAAGAVDDEDDAEDIKRAADAKAGAKLDAKAVSMAEAELLAGDGVDVDADTLRGAGDGDGDEAGGADAGLLDGFDDPPGGDGDGGDDAGDNDDFDDDGVKGGGAKSGNAGTSVKGGEAGWQDEEEGEERGTRRRRRALLGWQSGGGAQRATAEVAPPRGRSLGEDDLWWELKCADVVALARPADVYAAYRSSLNSPQVATLKKLEEMMGVQAGTLVQRKRHHAAGGIVTLTGFAALAGLVALAAVIAAAALAVALLVVRRKAPGAYHALGAVVKSRRPVVSLKGGEGEDVSVAVRRDGDAHGGSLRALGGHKRGQ